MDNHYLPQFLTRRWVRENDKKLTRYSRPYQQVKAKSKTPRSIGYSVDLYTQQGVPEEDMYVLEHEYFRDIDQRGSDALDLIENGGVDSLDQAQRDHWTGFVLSLRQRTPKSVARLENLYDQKALEILERTRDQYFLKKRPTDPDDFDEFLASASTKDFFETKKKEVIKWGIALPDTRVAVSGMKWHAHRTEETLDFLISDNMLIISDRRIALTSGYLACAIGPNSLFLATHNDDDLNRIIDKADLTQIHNELVISQADKYVYSRADTHLDLVERFLRKRS